MRPACARAAAAGCRGRPQERHRRVASGRKLERRRANQRRRAAGSSSAGERREYFPGSCCVDLGLGPVCSLGLLEFDLLPLDRHRTNWSDLLRSAVFSDTSKDLPLLPSPLSPSLSLPPGVGAAMGDETEPAVGFTLAGPAVLRGDGAQTSQVARGLSVLSSMTSPPRSRGLLGALTTATTVHRRTVEFRLSRSPWLRDTVLCAGSSASPSLCLILSFSLSQQAAATSTRGGLTRELDIQQRFLDSMASSGRRIWLPARSRPPRHRGRCIQGV
jgi:hypothetical protein